ncbi:hypothetical protein ACHAXA_005780 [Cyclostephanos tholiformis]|uniref:Uncharacterized protein n=1 Tax=Cyclostephanos tholiformis TaxID=382380 RepID=A0ABD3R1F1_9STRA
MFPRDAEEEGRRGEGGGGVCATTETTVERTLEGKTTILDSFREVIDRSIVVMQRIRNVGDAAGKIDRVDNVIEFSPLETVGGIFPEDAQSASSTSILDGLLNIVNPLKLKKAKVVLVHKAEVESSSPVLRLRIAWISSVLNVAGTSRYLNPDGDDVFGLNNVMGEFLNVGYFDTPYSSTVNEDLDSEK